MEETQRKFAKQRFPGRPIYEEMFRLCACYPREIYVKGLPAADLQVQDPKLTQKMMDDVYLLANAYGWHLMPGEIFLREIADKYAKAHCLCWRRNEAGGRRAIK